MVCNRCKMIVHNEFSKLGIEPESVDLGEITLRHDISDAQKMNLNAALVSFGFVLIDNKKSLLIEKIKTIVIKLVHHSDVPLKTNLSTYLSEQLLHDYTYLSNLFSEVEGTTIEQYVIAQKIERVKELLMYDERSLSEIALEMNYSSVSHLSKQFQKVTGFRPTHFKQLKEKKRTPLEEL